MLDEELHKACLPDWQERHTAFRAMKEELESIEQKNEDELSEDELTTKAISTWQIHDAQLAKPIFAKALQKSPENPILHYHFGMVLLEDEDPQGIEHLNKAVELESTRVGNIVEQTYTVPSLERMFTYFKTSGEEDLAEQYMDRLCLWYERYIGFLAERAGIKESDSYSEPELSQEKFDYLKEQLSAFKEVKRACIVKKDVKTCPEAAMYIVVVELSVGLFGNDQQKRQAVIDKICSSGILFPGHNAWVTDLIGAPPRLRSAIKSMPAAELFRR